MYQKVIPQKTLLCLLMPSILFLFAISVSATNPPITNNLVNISEGVTEVGIEDRVPEMIIEGNTIHIIWTRYESGSEAYLYYRRSTDKGETWETPQQIYQFKDASYGYNPTSQRLAVSGNNVYIGFVDYDYSDNGTGRLYLSTSSNSGASFGAAVELINSGGGYKSLDRSFIKAEGNNVAVAYDGSGAKEGIRLLFSSNNGTSFNETIITEDNNDMSDFWYDGNQLIVVHEYSYYFYGLNTGRVYVSVSNDNGTSFTTNKVSVTYTDDYGEHERCRCYHDQRYVQKVTKEGDNIHLIFAGYNTEELWTILYARSTNNGQTFESTVDINKGLIGENYLQAGQEGLAAKGGNVYLEYLSTSSKVYLVRSEDSGATLSEPEDLLTDNTHYIQTTWWPQLVIDPSDETGKTVYFGSGAMMSRKSVDGGQTFFNTTYLFPLLNADVRESVLKIDESGDIHWVSKGRWYWSYDYDIFYSQKTAQPEPSEENKALSIETIYNETNELVIIPSSPSIAFDSAMTGEAWIKILDGSSNKLNVFGKVNGYDGDTYQPSGYQMTFHESGGKRYLNTGVETDKGQFINWTGGDISDTLWHHIAFTYDANSGLNNFKTYFDGLLVLEQTVTGAIIPGDGLLMIGSRTQFYLNTNYLVDDIRLWNRALPQEELLENQTKAFTGEEDGLKLWLNFNDTFKDISGNGNDAIPLYLGELKTSYFDPPITSFDLYQYTDEISFNNKTQNANSYVWNFGNDETSEQGNPKYTYPTAGEYNISLKATNDNSVTSAIGSVTIEGLDRVEPAQAGNYGYTTISVFGGGLTTENTILILRKEGEEDIIREEIYSETEGSLSAIFNLGEKTLGDWDMVVSENSTEMILPNAFKIIEGVAPDPWVNLTGRGQILFNMWQTYTINYGNNGNVDAYGVPLWIAITEIPELEIEFVDFKIEEPLSNEVDGITGIKDSIPLFFIAEEYFSTEEKARVYPLYIPKIPANSSISIHIRIKAPASFNVETWVSDPFFTGDTLSEKAAFLFQDVPFSEMNSDARACIGLSMAKVFTEGLVGLANLSLPLGCINALVTSKWNPWDYKPKNSQNEVPTLGSTAWQMSSVIIGCAGDLPYFKAFKITVAVAQLAAGMYDAYQADKACRDAWLKKSGNKKGVTAVSSFDPNEMIGPSGFGDNNYIAKNNMMPYTILFENYSTATAPAHIVTVVDTLDLSNFDISEFGFSSFGWGDTILSPPGNKLKEFSMDVDLRPEINLITRISGKLDTLTGVIVWEFLSLNPETMNLEEDPFIGFLPPNTTSPEGEGFVSFSVGLKAELGTNSEIRNMATIIFDANEPIITNEYLNILDLDIPESEVNELTETSGSNFVVDWSGTDMGSGIRDYSIYVLENDTALYAWLRNTTNITAEFVAEIGSSYKFYSIATDNVNHMEAETGQYDAWTSVVLDIENEELVDGDLIVFPNPAAENIKIKLKNASCGIYLIELIGINGSLHYSQIYNDCNLQNGVTINVEKYNSGQYVLKIVYDNKMVSRKIMLQ